MLPLFMEDQCPVMLVPDLNHYLYSLSLEEGTGSNQLAVLGSMVGLFLLLVAIVGVVFLVML